MGERQERRELTGQEPLVEVAERLVKAYIEDGTSVVHYDVAADMEGKRVAVHILAVARPLEGDDEDGGATTAI